MSTPRRALVVADDLTGAGDTGVQFAEAGWTTRLERGRPSSPAWVDAGSSGDPAPDLAIAVTTDSRAREQEAAVLTREAIIARWPGADGRVYLKVDSTMRGSVAAQLQGALVARRGEVADAFVLLCPAYPAMGRTVEDGVVLVHGTPVTQSPAGRDPATPVRHDSVVELVPGAVSVPVAPTAEAWAQALREAAAAASVLVADAASQADLERLAVAVDLLGERVVVAGSAGLAGPLAATWRTGAEPGTPAPGSPSVSRPLVVVSSHHQAAHDQVRRLAEADDRVRVVETDAATLPHQGPPAPPAGGPVVLLSPTERHHDSGPGLARALARWARTWLAEPHHGFDALVLVGGDGAEAVLTELAADGITLRGRLLEGVPDGVVTGGWAEGLRVVTKAGGFGDQETLHHLVTALGTAPEPTADPPIPTPIPIPSSTEASP